MSKPLPFHTAMTATLTILCLFVSSPLPMPPTAALTLTGIHVKEDHKLINGDSDGWTEWPLMMAGELLPESAAFPRTCELLRLIQDRTRVENRGDDQGEG